MYDGCRAVFLEIGLAKFVPLKCNRLEAIHAFLPTKRPSVPKVVDIRVSFSSSAWRVNHAQWLSVLPTNSRSCANHAQRRILGLR